MLDTESPTPSAATQKSCTQVSAMPNYSSVCRFICLANLLLMALLVGHVSADLTSGKLYTGVFLLQSEKGQLTVIPVAFLWGE